MTVGADVTGTGLGVAADDEQADATSAAATPTAPMRRIPFSNLASPLPRGEHWHGLGLISGSRGDGRQAPLTRYWRFVNVLPSLDRAESNVAELGQPIRMKRRQGRSHPE